MRDRETADAVSRLLPRLTPAAVLLTDDPADAVRLLAAALSAPRALDGPDAARGALARQVLRPRWSAEQVIETPALPPPDDDIALAAALRALPGRTRATVVLHLVAGVPRTGAADEAAAAARLRDELARRDSDEEHERARRAALYRSPGTTPVPGPVVPDQARRGSERNLPLHRDAAGPGQRGLLDRQ